MIARVRKSFIVSLITILYGASCAGQAQAFEFPIKVSENFGFSLLLVEGPILFGMSRLLLGGDACRGFNNVTGDLTWKGIPNPMFLSRGAITCFPGEAEKEARDG